MKRPDPHLPAALTRLAELFEYGALEADTMPAIFIDHVVDEIKRLRGLLCVYCGKGVSPEPADPPRRPWPYHPHIDGTYTRCGCAGGGTP